jgi:hypothetical protein
MKQEMVSKISPQDLIRTIVDAIQTGLYVCWIWFDCSFFPKSYFIELK